MNKFLSLLFFIALFYTRLCYSQNPGEWVWLNGSNGINTAATFGTKGIPAAGNAPHAGYEACEWTDKNGNYWLYGGLDYAISANSDYGDLWKYNPVTNEWTWMWGPGTVDPQPNYGVRTVPSPTNSPGARSWGAATWVDNTGNLWMAGGFAGHTYNDLWKYDMSTNEWTWMKGPGITSFYGHWGTKGVPDTANYPPGHFEKAAAWTDSVGDLWFYGGGAANALWRYQIPTNTWTWMKGDSLGTTNYGTMGVEDSTVEPPSGYNYAHWKDTAGNFWLYPPDNSQGNAMFRYRPATNNWTWMSGYAPVTSSYHYGIKCVTDPANYPRPRTENRGYATVNGDFWMFGGSNYNDLWMYKVTTNQWTWVSGDSILNPPGNWGTIGVSAPTNIPSGRLGNLAWADEHNCRIYFWGGAGGGYNAYNDMWAYRIDPTCPTNVASCSACVLSAGFFSSDTVFCSETGMCIDFFDQSTCNPTSWQWSFPGGTPSNSTQQNPTGICYSNPGTYPVTLIVSNGTLTDTLAVTPLLIFGNAPVPPTITVTSGDTLYSSHGASYQWYLNGSPIVGATDSFYVAHQGGTYAVQITDGIGCSSISNGVVVMGVYSPLSEESQVQIYPNPFDEKLTVTVRGSEQCEVTLFDITSRVLLHERFLNSVFLNTGWLAKGVYLYEVKDVKGTLKQGKVVKE